MINNYKLYKVVPSEMLAGFSFFGKFLVLKYVVGHNIKHDTTDDKI